MLIIIHPETLVVVGMALHSFRVSAVDRPGGGGLDEAFQPKFKCIQM